MKKMTCEMCGSNDIVKQDGLFVCSYCGCKYSLEDARNLLGDGPIDVSGSTVKIDNSLSVKNHLENARRAHDKEDWEETEKYYNLVEQNDPSCVEAIFYSAFAKAMQTLIDQDVYKRQAAFNVLQNSVTLIDDNFNPQRDGYPLVKQISDDLLKMMNGSFVYTVTKNGYGMQVKNNRGVTDNIFFALTMSFCATLENIIRIVPENQEKAKYYSCAVNQMTMLWNHRNLYINEGKKIVYDKLVAYHSAWNAIDPLHPTMQQIENKQHDAYISRETTPEVLEKWNLLAGLSFVLVIFALIFAIIAIVTSVRANMTHSYNVSWMFWYIYAWIGPFVLAGSIAFCVVTNVKYQNRKTAAKKQNNE